MTIDTSDEAIARLVDWLMYEKYDHLIPTPFEVAEMLVALQRDRDTLRMAWDMQFENQKMAWARAQELERQRDELKAEKDKTCSN